MLQKRSRGVISLLLVLMTASYLPAALDEQRYSIEFGSIGIANPDKPLEVRKVNALKFFENRLYVGQGDYAINTGPTDIISYDPGRKNFVKEFTVDDEAIVKFCVVNDQLMVPGTDATESWEWGNFYVKNDHGWQKHRTLPHAGHVFDVAAYKGDLFISGMLMIKRPADYVAPGGVYISKDGGQTCRLSWMSPCDASAWNKCGSMVIYKDQLYVFPYFYTGHDNLNKFPEEYRAFQTTRFAGLYLFYKWDSCGPSDAAVYDAETGWTMKDLIPEPDVCKIEGFIFKDKLVMAAIHGKYVTVSPYAKNAVRALYIYDGQKTTKADLDYGILLDTLVKSDRLYLLVHRHGHYEIMETNDLSQWKTYALPKVMSRPMSIEHDGQAFYIGTADGNIFKSREIKVCGTADSGHDNVVRKFHISAALPHEARSCWGAIDGWQHINKNAKLCCEITQDDEMIITSDNVNGFTIELPTPAAKIISLTIDGQKETPLDILNCKTLKCRKAADNRWLIEKSQDGIDHTQYSKQKVIGHTSRKLTTDDPNCPFQLWKAEVLKWAANTDIGLVNHNCVRGNLEPGKISVQDIYHANYENDITTFSISGEDLLDIMAYNLQLVKKDQFQVSGFNLTWNLETKRVSASSLDPKKTYTVSTSSYVARRSERFFGRQLDYQILNIPIKYAMARWLMTFKDVPEIKQTITNVRQ